MINARAVTVLGLAALLVCSPIVASGGTAEKWLDLGAAVTADNGTEEAAAEPAPAAAAPPIPFHTIEGYGGAAFTPTAYLINPGPEGTVMGMPAVSTTYVRLGSKSVMAAGVTQTFFRRIELSYAVNRMDVGSLKSDLRKKAGADIVRDDIYLHHFNIRALLIEENSFDLPLPAITAGIHIKYNDTIDTIDRRTGGALSLIGYEDQCGVDYTLTFTKMFPTLAFGRPIAISNGIRLSKAAQLGYLGFGDECSLTLEGNVLYLPFDWLALVYEFRQKANPYKANTLPDIIGDEDTWHAISAHWIVNDHMTVTGAWICAGNIANAEESCGWALQAKWEF